MICYVLDTNIASYIIRDAFPEIRRHLARTPIEQVFVSAVTEGELCYDVARKPESTKLRTIVNEFLLRVGILPWGSGAARVYGELRAAREAAGQPMGNLDLMIAAQALDIGAVLVTNDHAFSRIPRLKTVNWTKPRGLTAIDRKTKS